MIETSYFTCKICEKKLEYTKGEIVLKNVKNKYFDTLISSYKYSKIIRNFILDFKFENKRYLYKFLSSRLIEIIKKYSINKQIDYILYVPISKRRYLERAYNQSYLIAKEISKALNIPIMKYGIIKIKHNKRQSDLIHKERFINIKNVYKVNKAFDFEGKSLLLIDDIYTTGSTTNECSRVLKQSGAKKIIVATIAIA